MFSNVPLPPSYDGKIRMREALFAPRRPLPAQWDELERITEFRYGDLTKRMLSGHLSFSEAFVAMCYALRVSNGWLAREYFKDLEDFGNPGNLMAGREMLSCLAVKEAWGHLTPEEVAGMVAATMLDVVCYPDYGPSIFENCGMGGDRGLRFNGETSHRKTINGSTLSTLVIASLGYPTAKHGSYSNTSSVGSTDAIERLGMVVDTPDLSVQQALAARGFHFSCAHAWKTVHDLSHAPPRRETVNHVVGPMTPPVDPIRTRLDKIVGVSEKLHPEVVVRAYELLRQKGLINLRNAAAVCGLDRVLDDGELRVPSRVREAIVLDELSPYASVVSILRDGKYVGTHQITPRMFGVTFENPRSVFVENNVDMIMEQNWNALRADDQGTQVSEYLAMNAAFSLYLIRDLQDDPVSENRGPDHGALKHAFDQCYSVIRNGGVEAYLRALIADSRSLAASAR